MTPSGINIYIRSLNSFFTWLIEEGHVKEHIVLKQLKTHIRPVEPLDEQDIKKLISYHPRGFYELRTWTLVCLLLDTGCRISEILDLRSPDCDFDNLLLSVVGKGNKYRKVPFSPEARKYLFRYQAKWMKKGIKGELVFGTRDGVRLRHRNVMRDVINLCLKVGIRKRIYLHLFRHSFACHWTKAGGSTTALSRILGHSSINTTNVYLRGLGVEDFKEDHARFSPLGR